MGFAQDVLSQAMLREQQRQAKLKIGQPDRPVYETSLDPETGLMRPEYMMDIEGLAGAGAMRDIALGEGPSKWAQYLEGMQRGEEATARDAAVEQIRRQTGMGEADLAMRGGLGGGARERIAMGGARDLRRGLQDISRGGAQARLRIGGEDVARRERMLGAFAPMEAKMREYNIGQALGEKTRKHASEMESYKQAMEAWAADRSARAQEQAGK